MNSNTLIKVLILRMESATCQRICPAWKEGWKEEKKDESKTVSLSACTNISVCELLQLETVAQ